MAQCCTGWWGAFFETIVGLVHLASVLDFRLLFAWSWRVLTRRSVVFVTELVVTSNGMPWWWFLIVGRYLEVGYTHLWFCAKVSIFPTWFDHCFIVILTVDCSLLVLCVVLAWRVHKQKSSLLTRAQFGISRGTHSVIYCVPVQVIIRLGMLNMYGSHAAVDKLSTSCFGSWVSPAAC